MGKATLPDISAPLPIVDEAGGVNSSSDGSGASGAGGGGEGLWASFTEWFSTLLTRQSTAFEEEEDAASSGAHPPPSTFSLRQCCNWGNLRTRLLFLCVLDLFGSLYGMASANRVRLISPLLNVTGLLFCYILAVGMLLTFVGIVGIVRANSPLVKIFFYWSLCSLVLNFALSGIDLNSIDKQCEFIWNNFDHSAYREKDRQLFARQCESYAFVFFSTVMVGIAFARLYYCWLIRNYYISITPEHEQHGGCKNVRKTYGYAPVGGRGGASVYSGQSHHAAEDDD